MMSIRHEGMNRRIRDGKDRPTFGVALDECTAA
jgi:hypothetical protein